MEEHSDIPVYNITVPITKSELTLRVTGDYHYGLDRITTMEMVRVLKKEQDKHRGNQFIIYTGDLIENNLNTSIGHGYDIAIRDPAVQKDGMRDALVTIQKHLYTPQKFKSVRLTSNEMTGVLSAGIIGNHEYRTRNVSGQWLQEDMYGPAKILDMRINGLIILTIVNKRLRMSKTYRIFASHRPNKSNATSLEVIYRNCKKKRADIPADIYVYGHFHKRLVLTDGCYDNDGKFKKVLYMINPSPLFNVEYADYAGFSPVSAGWFTECFLPLDPDQYAYSHV